jgi:hypothetical protein
VTDIPDSGYSTLLFTPTAALTVTPRADSPGFDPAEAAGLALRVNGLPASAFIPGAVQLVEVDLAAPCPAAALFIGGAPVSAEWLQHWRGHIREAIALDAPPPESVRRVIRRYLAHTHGLAGSYPMPLPSDFTEASALGLNFHGLFSTLLILK